MTDDHADGHANTRGRAQQQISTTDHPQIEPATQPATDSRDAIAVSPGTLAAHETVEQTIAISCASGTRSPGVWRGTPVLALVGAGAVPPETTHLVFATEDGYRACLDVRTALEGMLAVERDGVRLDAVDRPRLVCPSIDGARTVKGVSRVVPVTLPPATRPEDYEALVQET